MSPTAAEVGDEGERARARGVVLNLDVFTIEKPMDIRTLVERKQQLVEDIGSLPWQQYMYSWLIVCP